jgi:hypothetical protein
MKKIYLLASLAFATSAFAKTNTGNEVKKQSHDVHTLQPEHAKNQVSLDSLTAVVNNLKALYEADHAELQTEEKQLSKETADLSQLNEYSHATLQKYRGIIKAEIISELILTALMAAAILWLFMLIRKITKQLEDIEKNTNK